MTIFGGVVPYLWGHLIVYWRYRPQFSTHQLAEHLDIATRLTPGCRKVFAPRHL
jgi:hypothetical protein